MATFISKTVTAGKLLLVNYFKTVWSKCCHISNFKSMKQYYLIPSKCIFRSNNCSIMWVGSNGNTSDLCSEDAQCESRLVQWLFWMTFFARLLRTIPIPIPIHRSLNSVAWVCKRNIPTERTPLVSEVSANFCGQSVPHGRRDRSLRPYCWISRPEQLLFLPSFFFVFESHFYLQSVAIH
jgi:hypothetical protein